MAPVSGRYASDLLSMPGVAFDISIESPVERIQAYLDAYRFPASADRELGFDDKLMRDHIQLVSAVSTPERTAAVFSIRGGKSLTNRLGNLHGGAIALIYDMCTTMCAAPLAREGFWQFGGVSRTLSITYLRPVTPEMDVTVECEVLQMGRRLTVIKGQMRDRSTGHVLSTAEHHKASISFRGVPARI